MNRAQGVRYLRRHTVPTTNTGRYGLIVLYTACLDFERLAASQVSVAEDQADGKRMNLGVLDRGDPKGLPSIISEQESTRSDKQADHDGRGRRASDIVGLMPAHGNRHGFGICGINPRSLSAAIVRA